MLQLFAVYDRVAGTYGDIFTALNYGVAKRRFEYVMAQASMVAEDCELYCIGSYDTDKGTVLGLDKPDFVCRFEAVQQ